jgi:hypothetical protein
MPDRVILLHRSLADPYFARQNSIFLEVIERQLDIDALCFDNFKLNPVAQQLAILRLQVLEMSQ